MSSKGDVVGERLAGGACLASICGGESAPEAVMHKDFHASCAVTEWALQVA